MSQSLRERVTYWDATHQKNIIINITYGGDQLYFARIFLFILVRKHTSPTSSLASYIRPVVTHLKHGPASPIRSFGLCLLIIKHIVSSFTWSSSLQTNKYFGLRSFGSSLIQHQVFLRNLHTLIGESIIIVLITWAEDRGLVSHVHVLSQSECRLV